MDHGPQSRREQVSPPRIEGPENRDSIDGQTVTVWGTAEAGVSVELWDWLLPVGRTLTDGAGRWSITLEELESGDHMFFAQVTDPPSAPSNYATVRVQSTHLHRQLRRAPTIALHWEPPGAGIVRKLRAWRRRPDAEELKSDAFVEEEWERMMREHRTLQAAQQQVLAHPDAPVAARPVGDVSAPPLPIAHPAPETETHTYVDEVPIEIPVLVIEARRDPFELPLETLLRAYAPLDLGRADSALAALPFPEITSVPVAVATDPVHVSAEWISGVRPPIYRPLTQLAPTVTARSLGTAALITEPSPATDPSPMTEPRPMKRFRFFRSTPGGIQ